MNTLGGLAFTMIGVSVGLLMRVVDEVSTMLHGETELQYLERKYPNLLVRDWTDGTD